MFTSLHSRGSALKSCGSIQHRGVAADILRSVPVDIDAEVIANTPLSADYNVLGLAAPEIASIARAGQFVMVKAQPGFEPLLRRPFSVFELLRDRSGVVTGFSLLNKRIGKSTHLLYQARVGQRVAVLGPLGQSFTQVSPPVEAWLVAGGVGLAPFAVLAAQLRNSGTSVTLFYGARSAAELFYLDFFSGLGVRLTITTEDGSRGEAGRITTPLDRELASRPPGRSVMIYACGPEGMLAATAKVARRHDCPCEVSVERLMGCGMGGCYSCVVPMRGDDGIGHHVRSCLTGPVLDGHRIVWD
jgi:dihydroorotate dehydrogenase electron transfer subunit